MTLRRIAYPSPNYSSRGGSAVRLAVVHTAQGARTISDLAAFFANPASGVSSHTGIDDQPGVVGEYVRPDYKAWTAAAANPYSVQTELCAFAEWDSAEWDRHRPMLENCRQWIAEECARFGIPNVKLSAAQAQDGRSRGVCGHVDLGAAGGGHWDPGPSFPWDTVLAGGSTSPAAPTTAKVDENMVLTDPTSGGLWVVVPDPYPAAVWTYEGAPYLGATNSARFNGGKYPCVGIAAYRDRSGDGYTLILDWGDSGKGDGKSKDGSGDRYRRYHFPRDGSGK